MSVRILSRGGVVGTRDRVEAGRRNNSWMNERPRHGYANSAPRRSVRHNARRGDCREKARAARWTARVGLCQTQANLVRRRIAGTLKPCAIGREKAGRRQNRDTVSKRRRPRGDNRQTQEPTNALEETVLKKNGGAQNRRRYRWGAALRQIAWNREQPQIRNSIRRPSALHLDSVEAGQ